MKNKIRIVLVVVIIIMLVLLGYFLIQKIDNKNRKYDIEVISEYKYFVLKENNTYGVIDNKGNRIVDTKYEDVKIPNPEKAVFICYEGENTKVLNENQQQIFTDCNNIEPLRLKNISSDLMYEKSVLRYSENGKFGIIDLKGKKITEPIYEEVDTLQFKEGELLVKKDGKYGVININGATLVKANYDKIETDRFYTEQSGYKEAGYVVSKTTEEGYRYGYVNLKGKEIIEPKYNDLYRVIEADGEDVYIICAENGKYGLFRNNKKIIANEYQSLVYNEDNNIIIALKGKKYGVISISGNIVIPFEFKQIDITGEFIYATAEDNNVKTFNSNGQETNIGSDIAIIDVKNTEYKIYIQTLEGKTIYSIYSGEKQLTKENYTYIQYLYNNYFIACNENGKLGIIDNNENIKVQFKYNSIQRIENTEMIETVDNNTNVIEIYSNDMKKICDLTNATIKSYSDYIKVFNDEEIKYVSKDGKEVKNVDIFKNNKIFAKKLGDKWGFVNSEGSTIVDFKYESVTEVNEYGFAGIKLNGKWGVINSDGSIVAEPSYVLDDSEPIFIGQYFRVLYGNGEIYYTK